LNARLDHLGDTHMTDYLIKELGSSFVVAADGQDVLRCADEYMARQIVRNAEADCCPSNSISSSAFFSKPCDRRPPLANA
jgi:hypothetical protein